MTSKGFMFMDCRSVKHSAKNGEDSEQEFFAGGKEHIKIQETKLKVIS